MTTATDQLLGTSAASYVLKLSTSRVRQMAAAGDIPSIDTAIGGVFRRSDVERFASERAAKRSQTSEPA